MKRIEDIIAEFEALEWDMLEDFIARGWLRPARDDEDYVFEDIDLARLNLVYELHITMEMPSESTDIILQLVDRLYTTRAQLRELLTALKDQPETTRRAILDQLDKPAHDRAERV